jgi:hypothetical protein
MTAWWIIGAILFFIGLRIDSLLVVSVGSGLAMASFLLPPLFGM